MYNYEAQIPEEFSFQADDIIAVFATDPDGWWNGVSKSQTCSAELQLCISLRFYWMKLACKDKAIYCECLMVRHDCLLSFHKPIELCHIVGIVIN